ncbi:MAG: prepilin-type N-terminal cleavage/methylation domain-containing protein, partial [Cyanobacteria bacterium SIG32]|nr:prepilin-type N-terminal cleavage/methylation domain-containing protein [Cyanobacteria bacterium SIG32]
MGLFPRPAGEGKGEGAAFTLAEVLITLAIIGVVAAMTIPTLVANYQTRAWNTSATVFDRKLTEALKVMNVQGTLAGYQTTESFVEELSKHFKTTKICAND